jgi:hypothetical protein
MRPEGLGNLIKIIHLIGSRTRDLPVGILMKVSVEVPNPAQAAGDWAFLGEELPTRPPPPEEGLAKLFKLAKELKWSATMMTAGRDLHDIHTVLHMVSAWEQS